MALPVSKNAILAGIFLVLLVIRMVQTRRESFQPILANGTETEYSITRLPPPNKNPQYSDSVILNTKESKIVFGDDPETFIVNAKPRVSSNKDEISIRHSVSGKYLMYNGSKITLVDKPKLMTPPYIFRIEPTAADPNTQYLKTFNDQYLQDDLSVGAKLRAAMLVFKKV